MLVLVQIASKMEKRRRIAPWKKDVTSPQTKKRENPKGEDATPKKLLGWGLNRG